MSFNSLRLLACEFYHKTKFEEHLLPKAKMSRVTLAFASHMPHVIGQGCRLACFFPHNSFTFPFFYLTIVLFFDAAFIEIVFSSVRIIPRKTASKLNLKGK